jgi:hypothetical protein
MSTATTAATETTTTTTTHLHPRTYQHLLAIAADSDQRAATVPLAGVLAPQGRPRTHHGGGHVIQGGWRRARLAGDDLHLDLAQDGLGSVAVLVGDAPASDPQRHLQHRVACRAEQTRTCCKVVAQGRQLLLALKL